MTLTGDQFDLFLNVAIWFCAVMALFNLVRYRKRGASAFVLAGAFVSLGMTLFFLHAQWSQAWVIAGAVVTGACLIADVALKSVRHAEREAKR